MQQLTEGQAMPLLGHCDGFLVAPRISRARFLV